MDRNSSPTCKQEGVSLPNLDELAFEIVYDSYITNNRASNGRYWMGGVNYPVDKTFEVNESNINELVADALTEYIDEE